MFFFWLESVQKNVPIIMGFFGTWNQAGSNRMNVQIEAILRDSEIRSVRKQLAKLAGQARRRGQPFTEQQKADLLQQLVTDRLSGKDHQRYGARHSDAQNNQQEGAV